MKFPFRFRAPNAASKPAMPLPSPFILESLKVAALLDPAGKTYILEQLERDINAKALGWRPVMRTLFELLDIEALFTSKADPVTGLVIYSHLERKKLAAYVAHYYIAARDIEDFDKGAAYNRLLASLLENSTLIMPTL